MSPNGEDKSALLPVIRAKACLVSIPNQIAMPTPITNTTSKSKTTNDMVNRASSQS
jgi:hypothetical protein